MAKGTTFRVVVNHQKGSADHVVYEGVRTREEAEQRAGDYQRAHQRTDYAGMTVRVEEE